MHEAGFEREFIGIELELWADGLGKLATAELRIADATVTKAVALCTRGVATTPLDRISATEAILDADLDLFGAMVDRKVAKDELRFLTSLS